MVLGSGGPGKPESGGLGICLQLTSVVPTGYSRCSNLYPGQAGVSSLVEFIGSAAVRAKNQALFPGRVPHVRPSVHGPKKMGAAPSNATAAREDCGQEQESLHME